MKQSLVDALVEHLNAEFESYYIYLSMSGYFDSESWDGFASWMALQAEEEREHAMKFYQHLLQRGVNPKLLSIAEPKNGWESPVKAFEDALEHEKLITSKIEKLMDLAIEERDHGLQNLLRWFIDEQIEEESTVGNIVDRIQRVAGDAKGLMLLDTELGARKATGL
ncbi:MAG: ferritin [Candidatus Kariarchaeaceae archaeon]|jgi:ferritin